MSKAQKRRNFWYTVSACSILVAAMSFASVILFGSLTGLHMLAGSIVALIVATVKLMD